MSSGSRYIALSNQPPADIQALRLELQGALIAGVQRVHRHPSRRPGVFIGEAGIVLMDWRVTAFLPTFKLPTMEAGTVFNDSVAVPDSGSKTSFLETSVGHAVLILIEKFGTYEEGRIKRREAAILEGCIRIISGALQLALRERLDDGGCEMLYGRAGLLYALLLLRSEISSASLAPGGDTEDPLLREIAQLYSDSNLEALVDYMVKRGRFGASIYKEELEGEEQQRAPRLMWSKRYLGGAHGVAGILQTLISTPLHIVAPYWPDVVATVEWLVAIQEPSGNWATKAERHMFRTAQATGADDDVWCHGAPGFLISFSTLLTRISQPKTLGISSSLTDDIITALKCGGELVYAHGLLRKGVRLCHGVGGNVYALLAVSDALEHTINSVLAFPGCAPRSDRGNVPRA